MVTTERASERTKNRLSLTVAAATAATTFGFRRIEGERARGRLAIAPYMNGGFFVWRQRATMASAIWIQQSWIKKPGRRTYGSAVMHQRSVTLACSQSASPSARSPSSRHGAAGTNTKCPSSSDPCAPFAVAVCALRATEGYKEGPAGRRDGCSRRRAESSLRYTTTSTKLGRTERTVCLVEQLSPSSSPKCYLCPTSREERTDSYKV